MKIIDLLNKIANGEEVPKKIELLSNNEIFNYDNKINDYNGENGDYLFGEVITNVMNLQVFLNDEVEIIEEDKKIKKLKPEFLKLRDDNEHWEYVDFLRTNVQFLAEKVNEIIDKINEMENNK